MTLEQLLSNKNSTNISLSQINKLVVGIKGCKDYCCECDCDPNHIDDCFGECDEDCDDDCRGDWY